MEADWKEVTVLTLLLALFLALLLALFFVIVNRNRAKSNDTNYSDPT